MEDMISFSFTEGFDQFRTLLLAMAELKPTSAVMTTPDGGANVDRPPVITFLISDGRQCKIRFVFTSSSLSSEHPERRVGISFDSLRAHLANVTAVPDRVSFSRIGNRLDMNLVFFDDSGSGTYVGGSRIKKFPSVPIPIWISPKHRVDYRVPAQVTRLEMVPAPGFEFKVVFDTYNRQVRFETPLGYIFSVFPLWGLDHADGVAFPYEQGTFSFEQTSHTAVSAMLRTIAETWICVTQLGNLAIQCTLYDNHGVITANLQRH